MTVTVSLSYTSLKVCFGNTTHTRIMLDKLLGYQSWREGYGTSKFVIEYTVAGSAPILCDYDSEEKWLAILSGLDAVFDKPNSPVSRPEPAATPTSNTADLLDAESSRYKGDAIVYTGNNVSNILATQATRIRLTAAATPLPTKLTGEMACILENCDPPENQTPEAVAALIADYQPTWDRIVSAVSRPEPAATPPTDEQTADDLGHIEVWYRGFKAGAKWQRANLAASPHPRPEPQRGTK